MGYHTVLKNSSDYIDALKSARELAVKMSKKTDSHVFAYRLDLWGRASKLFVISYGFCQDISQYKL